MKKINSDVTASPEAFKDGLRIVRAWCRSAIANVIAAKEGHKLLEAREFLKQQKKHRTFSAKLDSRITAEVTEVKRVVGY